LEGPGFSGAKFGKKREEASVGRRFRWLFPAIYGVKGDEYKLGFAREEDMSLSVLVYP
jgi:hypothetical protein